MTKKIKLTSLLLALSVTLAACSSGDNDDKDNDMSNNKEPKTTEESKSNDTNDDKSNDNKSDNNTESDDKSDDSASKDTDEIDVSQFNKTLDDAIKEAKSKFDGELTEIGIEQKANQWVYDIELENESEEYKIAMNVDTLEVVKESRDPENHPDKGEYFKYEDLVKVEDAIKTAKNQVDGKVTEVSTDWDNQKLYYEVTILKDDGEDVDVMIDAHSGDFVEIDD